MKKIGTGKSIVLVLPQNFYLSMMVVHNFEYHGFDIIYYHGNKYKYKSLMERLINRFRKTVLRDKDYKKRQQTKEFINKLEKKSLDDSRKIDYALFINAEIHPVSFIKEVGKYTNNLMGYAWDGLERFPDVFDRIEIFDKFFVFDEGDIHKYPDYNLYLTNNFFFDKDNYKTLHYDGKVKSTTKEIYFLGGHLDERVTAINRFINVAIELQLNIKFLIANASDTNTQMLYDSNKVQFIEGGITYIENLTNAINTDVIIDIVNNEHSGLSFRTFEAMNFEKKLITTNLEVTNYDFYDKDNIFVWDGINLNSNDLEVFLQSPYKSLPIEVVKKYSFQNWASYMLNIEPFISLSTKKSSQNLC